MDNVRRVAGGSSKYPRIAAQVKDILRELWAALGNLTKGMLLRVVAPTLDGNYESLWGVIRAPPNDPEEPFLFDMLVLQQRGEQVLCHTPSIMKAQRPTNHILVKSTLEAIELKNSSGLQRANIHWQRLYLPTQAPTYEEIDLLRKVLSKTPTLLNPVNDAISRLHQYDLPAGLKLKIIYGHLAGRCGTLVRSRLLPGTCKVSLEVALCARENEQDVIHVLLGHTRFTPTVGDIVDLDDSRRGFVKQVDSHGVATIDNPFQVDLLLT